MGIVPTREMAEEIVADVFISVWKKKEDLHQVANLKWYLYAATRNISLNYLRKYAHKKTVHPDEAQLPEYEINPEAQLISNNMMRHSWDMQRRRTKLPARMPPYTTPSIRCVKGPACPTWRRACHRRKCGTLLS